MSDGGGEVIAVGDDVDEFESTLARFASNFKIFPVKVLGMYQQ